MNRFDVNNIRKNFPILKKQVNNKPLVYFDNAATSQTPSQVTDALINFYNSQNSNIHRGIHTLSNLATDAYESARLRIGRWFGVNKESEIILLRGATEGLNLVAHTLKTQLKSGQTILVGESEHHANIVPWQQISQSGQFNVEPIPMEKSGKLSVSWTKSRCKKGDIGVIAIGHVSNAIGCINDVEAFIELAKTYGAFSVLDGAQSAPHMRVDLSRIRPDFYAISGHKMCGPTGVGVLFGQESLLEKLPPWQGGGDMIETVSFKGTTYNKLPWKFEAGTPNIAGAIGFSAALDFLEKIDFTSALEHEKRIHTILIDGLRNKSDVTILGNPSDGVSVCSFNVKNTNPSDIATLLDQFGIAVRTGHHCAMPTMEHFGLDTGTARVSLAFYNTENEVKFFLSSLDNVAGMLN